MPTTRLGAPSGPRESFRRSPRDTPARISGFGKHRYVIERVFAKLFLQRRLGVRYKKCDDIHQAFLSNGCIRICWNGLTQFC